MWEHLGDTLPADFPLEVQGVPSAEIAMQMFEAIKRLRQELIEVSRPGGGSPPQEVAHLK